MQHLEKAWSVMSYYDILHTSSDMPQAEYFSRTRGPTRPSFGQDLTSWLCLTYAQGKLQDLDGRIVRRVADLQMTMPSLMRGLLG